MGSYRGPPDRSNKEDLLNEALMQLQHNSALFRDFKATSFDHDDELLVFKATMELERRQWK